MNGLGEPMDRLEKRLIETDEKVDRINILLVELNAIAREKFNNLPDKSYVHSAINNAIENHKHDAEITAIVREHTSQCTKGSSSKLMIALFTAIFTALGSILVLVFKMV